jgi:hypothetical protein
MVVEGVAALHGSVTFFTSQSAPLGDLGLGNAMIRPFAALTACATVLSGLALLWLAGCADNTPPSEKPTFYIDLAQPGAVLDANAAQSMISGYRGNNGLTPVTIDPELMRLANDQASAMAARDIFRLARFTATPRQHAQWRRDKNGHRRGLYAEVKIQGILGADPRQARRAPRLIA